MHATLRDVAAAAGVHPATASRALNQATRSQVSAKTVARVQRAAADLNYEPNPLARSLKTSRSATLGVILPDITSPLFAPMVRGIEDVALASGYGVFVCNTDYDLEREAIQLAALRGRRVDGLIAATGLLQDPQLVAFAETATPLVLLNRSAGVSGVSSVTADDAEGIELAVAHLAGLGHRQIAHVSGPLTTSTGRTRSQGFAAALASHGLDSDLSLIVECKRFRESDGRDALMKLLGIGRTFTGVVCADDRLALGCYDALRSSGLLCPGDISVVGFNDLPLVAYSNPPLTTVATPHYEMGVEAAQLLFAQIDDPHARRKSVVLPTSLVVRESTAPAIG